MNDKLFGIDLIKDESMPENKGMILGIPKGIVSELAKGNIKPLSYKQTIGIIDFQKTTVQIEEGAIATEIHATPRSIEIILKWFEGNSSD